MLNNNTTKTTQQNNNQMKANRTDTRRITTTQHKYKYKLQTKKSLSSLIENKLLSDVYNNT